MNEQIEVSGLRRSHCCWVLGSVLQLVPHQFLFRNQLIQLESNLGGSCLFARARARALAERD